MATVDLTRKDRNNNKASVSLASFIFDEQDKLPTANDHYVLFCLPKKASIVGLFFNIESAGSGSINLGFDGGSELLENFDVSVQGSRNTWYYNFPYIPTGNITITPSAPTGNLRGSLSLMFIEPELKTNELMRNYAP